MTVLLRAKLTLMQTKNRLNVMTFHYYTLNNKLNIYAGLSILLFYCLVLCNFVLFKMEIDGSEKASTSQASEEIDGTGDEISPEYLQRKLYFLLEQLKQMHSELPELVALVIKLLRCKISLCTCS